MAHYAFINSDNIVLEVITGKDESDTTMDWEQHYAEFRPGQRCLRTSYNTAGGVNICGGLPFRKNFAGIGYSYDSSRDAFIPPKPFPSWVLNEDTCVWNPPVPRPNDGQIYKWNEANQIWILV